MHQAKRPTANGDRRLLTVVQLLGAMPKLAMIWRLQDAEWRRERGSSDDSQSSGGSSGSTSSAATSGSTSSSGKTDKS